jgi:DNA-binding NarL/FixJ family response regulator
VRAADAENGDNGRSRASAGVGLTLAESDTIVYGASTSPKRVLLVDDEPGLLAALRGVLRRRRRDWDVAFALGGRAALQEMARTQFDAVITDLRMPEVNGLDVLREARALQPHAARVVFSGQTDHADVVATIWDAHRFVAKPCDSRHLERIIDEVCTARDLQPCPRLWARTVAVAMLAPSRRTLAALERVVACPRPGYDEAAREIGRDPALSAKLLQLANSDYFTPARPTSSVAAAVGHLGIAVVRDLLDACSAGTPSTAGDEAQLDEPSAHEADLAASIGRLAGDPTDPLRTGAALLALWGCSPPDAPRSHATT